MDNNDRRAFLDKIRAEPDENSHRLVYTDWLDDNPDGPCPECKGAGECSIDRPAPSVRVRCPKCAGSGITRDPVRAAHAALIRVQCEYARETAGWKPENLDCLDMYLDPDNAEQQMWKHRVVSLRDRRKNLLDTHETTWRTGPACDECGGKARWYSNTGDSAPCRGCGGTGDAGGLLRTFDYDTRAIIRTRSARLVRIEWDRGFISKILVPRLADVITHSQDYPGGTGPLPPRGFTTTLFLRQLRTLTPYRCIQEIVPLGCDPLVFADTSKAAWADGSDLFLGPSHRLPQPIFDTLDGYERHYSSMSEWKIYPTRVAAVSALGRAVFSFK